jgi:hypothetical protein
VAKPDWNAKQTNAPWFNTIIDMNGGVPTYPLRFSRTRWQWRLADKASGNQIKVGMRCSAGTVLDIRLGGRILVESRGGTTWRSPAQIGARWFEYRDGRLEHVYGADK